VKKNIDHFKGKEIFLTCVISKSEGKAKRKKKKKEKRKTPSDYKRFLAASRVP